ncbi:transcription factor E4F1-like [Megalops cyprinoides]|uniref:transcription factor E4F1-like n=1 Tax=Megalops cyprinoides TaxID=118141 RepID=UPI001863E1C9|nr:transcription factor E4F1-like [Megalops cyprinoides]
MSEAILTFHSQLSAVMETVLKAAVYEITRLVEVSFLEEATQSRQEVEALRERLRRSERRWAARERDRRAKCAECSRAVPSVEVEHSVQGIQPGAEDGCGIKEEEVLEVSQSSCIWEARSASPPGVAEEAATPSLARTPETIDLEEDRFDRLPKTDELREVPRRKGLQGQDGAESANAAHLNSVIKDGEEWCTRPSSAHALTDQQSDRWGAGGGSAAGSLYRPKPGLEHVTPTRHLTSPERCTGRVSRLGSDGVIYEGDGLRRSVFTQDSSRPAEKQSEDHPELECAGSCLSAFGSLHVKPEMGVSDCGSVKEEVEMPPVCSEEASSAIVLHREYREDREKMLPVCLPHIALPEDVMRLYSAKTTTPALQSREEQYALSGKNTLLTVTDGRGLANSDALNENDCNLCDMSFSSSNAEADQRECAGEKSFSCLHCGKRFNQLRNLKDHQRYHTGNKTHSCVHCGKGFVYMCHLKVHLQSHTGERPYSCTQCGKSFTYLCNLKSHQQYHTGEKPFSCTQCGKSFRHLSHLKKHRFMHTGERPYRCTDCGKRFAANGDLKRHQRIHTR